MEEYNDLGRIVLDMNQGQKIWLGRALERVLREYATDHLSPVGQMRSLNFIISIVKIEGNFEAKRQ